MSDISGSLSDLVAKAKVNMQIEDDDASLSADGLAVFCTDANTSAATVQVTDTTVVLVIVDGAGAATTTLTLADAANDTLGELATVIDGTTGWTGTLLGKSDVDSGLLIRKAATGALTQANEQTLLYENNELLEQLITNIWAGIETNLCRGILSTAYSKVFDRPMHGGELVLDEPDVTQVSMLASGTDNGLTVKYTGAAEIARVEVTATAVVTTSIAAGVTTTTTTLFSAQVTTTLMASTINGLAGWTATVDQARPSAFLVQTSVRDAKDTQITLETWADDGGGFEVDYLSGVIDVNGTSGRYGSWPCGSRMRVDYTAGFAAIPADVEQALLDAVKVSFDAGRQTAGLKSEKLGDYSYEVVDAGASMAASHGAAATAAATLRTGYARFMP